MQEKSGTRKVSGKHDYSGNSTPKSEYYYGNNTFSVGIFQWVPKTSGKGLKKSPVKIRVKGYSSDQDQVYRLADIFCDRLDMGEDPGVKVVWASDVKWLEFVRNKGGLAIC